MGFSVLPPNGPHWYLYLRGADHIGFGKRDPEHYKQPSDRTHTFVVIAASLSAANADIKTMEGLMQVLGQFLVRDAPPRCEILNRKLTPYREQGTDCARFEVVNLEKNNPHAPVVIFVATTAGKMCRNPAAPRPGGRTAPVRAPRADGDEPATAQARALAAPRCGRNAPPRQ